MKKKDEMLMNKTEMRMLRWIQGVSLREHKRNEEIREAATVQPIATHLARSDYAGMDMSDVEMKAIPPEQCWTWW